MTVIEWRVTETGLKPFAPGVTQPIAWAPQPGSQTAVLQCPVTELLYHGNRGPGKSETMLMAFAQYVGKGYGPDWRGIIFRRNKTEHENAVARARTLFSEIFPTAEYNISSKVWTFVGGETLRFGYLEREEDFDIYKGQQYSFIGWDELTNWRNDVGYRAMFSCLRAGSHPGMPRLVRATCNPDGVGHSWVKQRFRLPHIGMHGPIIKTKGEPNRIAVRGDLYENKILLHADPDYIDRLRASASTPARFKAWVEGSWDIVAGAFFSDLWQPDIHIIPPIPLNVIPKQWRLDRAYDDGLSHPFSVGWYAQSNGEPFEWQGRRYGDVKGDLFRLQEWYGWNGTPNQGLRLSSKAIAQGILEREERWGVRGRVYPGPADGAIYNASPRDPSASIASDMAQVGVTWEKADKSPGSRHLGLSAIRTMLAGAIPDASGRRESPGFFVSSVCEQMIRTLPAIPVSKKDLDDIDTEAEDHTIDELRYRIKRPRVVEVRQPFLRH